MSNSLQFLPGTGRGTIRRMVEGQATLIPTPLQTVATPIPTHTKPQSHEEGSAIPNRSFPLA